MVDERLDRQQRCHVALTKPGSLVVLTVPLHRELGPGVLRSLIIRNHIRKAAA